jgi:hypothetical protein
MQYTPATRLTIYADFIWKFLLDVPVCDEVLEVGLHRFDIIGMEFCLGLPSPLMQMHS